MNYQQLSEAIQSYAESTEQLFVFNIPNFVQLCEERVYNAVQIPAIRKNVIGNFTQGDHYLALPEDYLASFSLAVIDADGNYEYLIDKDVNFIRQAYPTPMTKVCQGITLSLAHTPTSSAQALMQTTKQSCTITTTLLRSYRVAYLGLARLPLVQDIPTVYTKA
jgi:hypothetical protein